MITRQLRSMFVLGIGVLALLGCGSQSPAPGNMTQASNQTLSKIDSADDVSADASASESSPADDATSSKAQGRVTQLVIPNPRQNVLSSGFERDY
jgi:hypothetical protein